MAGFQPSGSYADAFSIKDDSAPERGFPGATTRGANSVGAKMSAKRWSRTRVPGGPEASRDSLFIQDIAERPEHHETWDKAFASTEEGRLFYGIPEEPPLV